MAVSRSKKEEVLSELIKKLEKAVAIVFVKNSGLTVEELSALRKELRKQKNDFKIAKKTLIKKAMLEVGYPEADDSMFDGAVGVTFSFDDEVAPAKALHDFAKTHDKLELLGAVLEKNKVLSKKDVLALATLPSKEQLIAQLVGTMKSPISGFHGVLSGTLRGFVQVVSQYKDKKAAA